MRISRAAPTHVLIVLLALVVSACASPQQSRRGSLTGLLLVADRIPRVHSGLAHCI